MQKVIDRKYATAILYDQLSHGADLIQARGLKRFFEYHGLCSHNHAVALMRRMANRRWQAAFPKLADAVALVSEYNIDKFQSVHPNTVSNEVYTSSIKLMVEACLKHEQETKALLNEVAKTAPLEDMKVYEEMACETDHLCKELMRMITHYMKYGWSAPYLEQDQREMHDCYEKKMEEKFKVHYC